MTPKEHLIERLRALCGPGDGYQAIALEIDASAEGLKQILAGTKLPSGQPRGVGPELQRKLEARYPGWAKDPAVASNAPAAFSPQALSLAAALDSIQDPRAHAAAYLAALELVTPAVRQAHTQIPRRKQSSAGAA